MKLTNSKIKKDNLIFLHKFLKSIADSIINIFIPLYILKVTGNFNLALGYLAIYSAFVLIFMHIFKKIIQKYGILTIILHFLPIIAAEALLSILKIDVWIVSSSAVLMAISQVFYSVPINIIFSFGDKKTDVAKFQIATNIGKLIFTIISGYIISSSIKNSFIIMCFVSALFYIVSVIPLGYSYKELKQNYKIYEENFAKFSESSEHKIKPAYRIFHACFGLFQGTIDNVVPLYLFINNLSFEAVALVIALIELCKIGTNYLAKILVKYKKEKISCIVSFIIFIASLTAIVFVKNNIALYVLSCTCSVSFPLTFVPMFRNFCKDMQVTDNIFDGMVERDIDIFSARPIYYGSALLGVGLYPCFGLGLASVIIMLICEIKIVSKKVE